MQGGPHLLFAELIERIGFVRAELIAHLSEQRFCFVSFAQSNVGSSKQIDRIASVPLLSRVKVPRNLQIDERVLGAASFEQRRTAKYPGRNRMRIEFDRPIELR